jgi:hypothetical protein
LLCQKGTLQSPFHQRSRGGEKSFGAAERLNRRRSIPRYGTAPCVATPFDQDCKASDRHRTRASHFEKKCDPRSTNKPSSSHPATSGQIRGRRVLDGEEPRDDSSRCSRRSPGPGVQLLPAHHFVLPSETREREADDPPLISHCLPSTNKFLPTDMC